MTTLEHIPAAVERTPIERKIAQLRFAVESSVPKNDTLLSGRIGQMIYYFYLFRHYQNELYGERGVAVLEEIIGHIQAKTSPYLLKYPFSYGLSGFGFAMSLLIQEEIIDLDFEEQLTEFDTIIYEAALPELQKGNTDFLHGASGAMLYLSRRTRNVVAASYLDALVQTLSELAIRDERGLRFPNTHIARLNESNNVNFGLAHGQCGILLVLLRVYEQGIAQETIKTLVDEGIRYLLGYQQRPDFATGRYSQFPLTIDETQPWNSADNQKEYGARLGWCYGDLNETLLLYQAGKLFGRADWLRLAHEVGEETIARQHVRETIIKDSHFCHGSAGVAQYYKRFYEQTGYAHYHAAYQFWLGRTMQFLDAELTDEVYLSHSGELLEGFVGISLVLLSAIADENYAWDQLFLLS